MVPLIALIITLGWTHDRLTPAPGVSNQTPTTPKIAINRLIIMSNFDTDGGKQTKLADGRLTELTVSAYLEYGLRECLTLVAAAPFKRLEDKRTFSTGVGFERDTNFGDLKLLLRYQL